MLHRVLVLSALVACFALGSLPAQEKQEKKEPSEAEKKKAAAIKKDRQRLQGTWNVAEFKTSGEPLPEADLKSRQVIIAGEQLTMTLAKDKGNREYTYTLDPTQTPRAIDLNPKMALVKTPIGMPGIYEFDGEDLKLCLTRLGGKLRPKEFESTAQKGTILIILKKAK